MSRAIKDNNQTAQGLPHRLTVLQVLEPGIDGAFVHLNLLTRWLTDQQHRVHLAYSSERSSPALFNLVEHVEHQGGRTLDLRTNNFLSLRDLSSFLALKSFVQQTNPQIIHAHSSKAGGFVRLLPKKLGGHRFYTPHAYYGLRPGRSLGGGFFNRIERLLRKRAFTINVSQSEAGFAETVLHVPADKRATIPNGVDMRRFHVPSSDERRTAREKLGLPKEARILLSISRLCFQKDPATLYKAFHAAAAQREDLHLLHLCTGRERNYAEEAYNGPHKTRIHRFHEQQDPLPFYHAADGFILSSRYEGLPLVVLEAMSCGLPLILSAVSGNDDILNRKPDASWWFVAQDYHRAADCILDWAQSGQAPNNHRNLIAQYHSCDNAHHQIEQLYLQEVLQHP